jgi:hypothetical protein
VLQYSDLMAERNVSSCGAAQLFSRAEATPIMEIHSHVERVSLRNVCNSHHLNQFDINESHRMPLTQTFG